MDQVIRCPACGYTGFEFFTQAHDFCVSRQLFQLERCSNCGLLATNPQPNPDTIAYYYQSEQYISHTGKSANWLIDIVYPAIRKLALNRKRRIIEKHQPCNTKSYIGCGTGEFLHEMKRAGWSVTGVEPDQHARKKAQAKLNQLVFEKLEEIPQSTYQVITFWHVLEHLHFPEETLKKCHGLLKPGGMLLIALPNYQSWDGRHYQNFWAGYDVPRHLWHFTTKSVEMLLEQQEYQLLEMVPMWWDAYYISLLSEIYRNKPKNVLAQYWNGLISGIKSNLHARKTGQYSSLLYLAVKHAQN